MFGFPWDIVIRNVGQGNITVAGDAMHPMTPDLGQNEFLTLEDAVAWGQQFGELITHSQGLVPGEVVKGLRPKKICSTKEVASCWPDDDILKGYTVQ